MFYAAIAPLLPYYRDELDISKSAAGVLAGAYPAGTLVGSLPGGWLAARVGVRPTVLVGLTLLSGSSLVFGFADQIALLDAARFVQGLGGAASWAGALSWLVTVGARERRGELIGTAFGAAVGGALLGPVLGAAANAIGPRVVFPAVALLSGALAAWAVREPAPPAMAAPVLPGLGLALRERDVLAGVGVILLVGLFFGLVEVLVPLRLDHLGAGAAVIGGAFLAAAALQALTSPVVGRLSDRRGQLLPVRAALLCATALALVLPLPTESWLLVVLVVVGGPSVGALWVPGMAVLSQGADRATLDQGLAFALVNLAWALAQTIGSAGGGGIADSGGDSTAYAALAVTVGLAFVATMLIPGRRSA